MFLKTRDKTKNEYLPLVLKVKRPEDSGPLVKNQTQKNKTISIVAIKSEALLNLNLLCVLLYSI